MLIEQIKQDKLEAMRRHDSATSQLLGLVISDCQRKQDTSDESIIKVIQYIIKNNRETLTHIDAGGFKAQELNLEISKLEQYLPKSFTGTELKEMVYNTMREKDIKEMRGMGVVMGIVNKYTKEKGLLVNGAEVKDIVQEFIKQAT